MRFGKSFGNDVFLKIVSDYKPVAVPDDFSDKSIYKQFTRIDVIRVFEGFGEKILFNIFYCDMGICFLRFSVYPVRKKYALPE